MHRRKLNMTLLLLCCLLAVLHPFQQAIASSSSSSLSPQPPNAASAQDAWQQGSQPLYLPLVSREALSGSTFRRVNAPYFADSFKFGEAAIFWFGQVTNSANYADVRVGYTQKELIVRVGVIDKFLWYQRGAGPQDFQNWDAISVYLNLDGDQGNSPAENSYRFDSLLNWDEDDALYQAGYQGIGNGWSQEKVPFATKVSWSGNAPNNNDKADAGWTLHLSIPFSSLGLAGAPAEGTVWGLGVQVHDRDSQDAAPLPAQVWPRQFKEGNPSSWGQLSFGMPTYQPPNASSQGSVRVRQGLNGAQVVDVDAGGGTECGDGLKFWDEWGWKNYAGLGRVNIQSQGDIADWPCFSKYYLSFPLGQVPAGKVILSAKVTLHQFGNAGGGEWGDPPESVIQVLTVGDGWSEDSLNWNNAPLAAENISMSRVPGLLSSPDWPGVPHTWDVSQAVASAYASGRPLSLVFYSADAPRHTGKYFVSSDAADWNAEGRPTLDIVWGNP